MAAPTRQLLAGLLLSLTIVIGTSLTMRMAQSQAAVAQEEMRMVACVQ